MMTHDEMIAVIQAHKEGKKIEIKYDGVWEPAESPQFDFRHNVYRVKPEPHYLPFKNAEEVMEAVKEHNDWIKVKGSTFYHKINLITNKTIEIDRGTEWKFSEALDNIIFADGTPFGAKED